MLFNLVKNIYQNHFWVHFSLFLIWSVSINDDDSLFFRRLFIIVIQEVFIFIFHISLLFLMLFNLVKNISQKHFWVHFSLFLIWSISINDDDSLFFFFILAYYFSCYLIW